MRKGWGKEEAARTAKMSSITWSRVENALPVRDDRLGAIEHALGWEPDTASKIMAGLDPAAAAVWNDVPVGPSDEGAEYVAHPGPGAESIPPDTARELLEEIRRVARDVEDIKRRLDGS